MKREPTTILLLCIVILAVTLAGVQATQHRTDKRLEHVQRHDKHLEHVGMQHVGTPSRLVQAGKHIQHSVLKLKGKSAGV
jgi:hypothetical protein